MTSLKGKKGRDLWALGPWNKRIDELSGALGWTRPETAKVLGIHTDTLDRIKRGGRPKTKVLIRLQENETKHQAEIAEYVRSGRKRSLYRSKRRRRDKLHELERGLPRSLSDLSQMGVLAASSAEGWATYVDSEGKPLKLVYFSPKARGKRRQD